MKVPVSSPHKSSISYNAATTTSTTLCYEPTSVLDLHSPVAEKTPTSDQSKANLDALTQPGHNNPQLDWDHDDHVLHNLDWDSIMNDLGLQEVSSNNNTTAAAIKNINTCESQLLEFPTTQFVHNTDLISTQADQLYSNQSMDIPFDMSSDFLTSWPNTNTSLDFVEELIRAADLFDSNELHLVQVVLTRLNSSIPSPIGKPLQRAAFYFKEALQFLLTGLNVHKSSKVSSWHEIVQTIRAQKAFSAISPIPMFTQFTANQALLETLHNSMLIHVIDFDIGLGGQYASFMRELAERTQPCRVLRITAIVHEDYTVETKLISENLTQFAHELKISFHIEFVLVRDSNMFSFKSVKFMEGEKTAVLLSQSIFHRLGSTNSGIIFVDSIRRISPSVVVYIDNDGWVEAGGGTASFRRNFMSSLEFYTMMLESLDMAAGGVNDWVRKIEEFILRPKIFAAVEGAAVAQPWREVFHGAGMRAVQLSQFADFQAECLLGKVQVRGFQVAKRQAELVLCWNERALVATSAWRC